MRLSSVAAFVFDMDGVITDTAKVHARAWKRLFDEYLGDRPGGAGSTRGAFDADADYRRYVDGKPRYDGVDSFLRSRGIILDRGDPADPPDRQTVCGLGNRKNGYFLEILSHEKVSPLPSVVATLKSLRAQGFKLGLISASRNARQVLNSAGVTGLFDAIVDGVDSEDTGLHGKPAPDIFLRAAQLLGATPGTTAVVEDSLAGVEAGRRGGFAVVIGVGSGRRVDELRASGADFVIAQLSAILPAIDRSPRQDETA